MIVLRKIKNIFAAIFVKAMTFILALILIWPVGMIIFFPYDRYFNHEPNIEQSFGRYLNFIFDGTNYAEGFTFEKFRSLRVGMSKEDVLVILGEPIAKDCEKYCIWYYTERFEINLGPYEVKNLEFEDKRITKIEDYYHLD